MGAWLCLKAAIGCSMPLHRLLNDGITRCVQQPETAEFLNKCYFVLLRPVITTLHSLGPGTATVHSVRQATRPVISTSCCHTTHSLHHSPAFVHCPQGAFASGHQQQTDRHESSRVDPTSISRQGSKQIRQSTYAKLLKCAECNVHTWPAASEH